MIIKNKEKKVSLRADAIISSEVIGIGPKKFLRVSTLRNDLNFEAIIKSEENFLLAFDEAIERRDRIIDLDMLETDF